MLIIFRRTVMKDGEVRVITDGVIEGKHRSIGTLLFPSSKTWSKFWGAIQRGALNIADLEVKLENLPLEDANNEKPPNEVFK